MNGDKSCMETEHSRYIMRKKNPWVKIINVLLTTLSHAFDEYFVSVVYLAEYHIDQEIDQPMYFDCLNQRVHLPLLHYDLR